LGNHLRRIFQRESDIRTSEIRIDFSFKREVFFIVAGALMGGLAMAIPLTFLSVGSVSGYDLTWIIFGHIVGVHSPISANITAGFMIHFLTASCIGIIAGVFLYKTNILNISKPSNGLRYGLLVGIIVYLVFAIPVEQFVLNPEFRHTALEGQTRSKNTVIPPMQGEYRISHLRENSRYETTAARSSDEILPLYGFQIRSTITTITIHLLFGITLGLFSSLLSMKFGARYRCPRGCDISFSRIDILQNHLELIHGDNPSQQRKRIIILGGGFGGVSVLKKLQDNFQTDVSVDITMVSKENYMLFTPMLHEVASGMLETRHIVTPVRTFCKRSRFCAAVVESIDIQRKQVLIRSSSASTILQETNDFRDTGINFRSLDYDYLVIALGSETKFFDSDVQKHALTIKNLNDAIILRNHIIYLLEQADQLPVTSVRRKELQSKLLTIVVVGGGFAGVETAGEINDFLRDSAKEYYHNIDSENIRVVIVQSGKRLLPEMSEKLAEFALQKLRSSDVEVIFGNRVIGATEDSVKLNDGTKIPTKTIIWSGGVSPTSLITSLTCEHDIKSGRIVVDKYLQLPEYKGVYALGDCAFITDPNTGASYPPTAQHAIREGLTVAKNIIADIKEKSDQKEGFNYKTKGMMATVGKRSGVGNLFGIQVQGFSAWWIWRNYYLVNLPTIQKKARVLADWILDIFFKRDVTMLRALVQGEGKQEEEKENFKVQKL
jgi:NADH:quinone reductase (non-electrogenic)